MSNPSECDQIPLKRLGRYLVSHPRCVSIYRWQDPVARIEVFSDSDWDGDQKSIKSTTGGCIMLGRHSVSHWPRTQQIIAMSSAEAELNALCSRC